MIDHTEKHSPETLEAPTEEKPKETIVPMPEAPVLEAPPEVIVPEVPAQPQPEVPSAPEAVETWPKLTAERIAECKVLNQGRPVYLYDQLGVVIVYKSLIGSEYNELSDIFRKEGEKSTSERQDEQYASFATLWPRLPDDWFQSALAGHAQTLALLVRQQSGISFLSNDGRVIGKHLTTEEIDAKDQPAPEEPTEDEIKAIRALSPGNKLFLATYPDASQNLFIPLPRIEWTSINKRMEKDPDLDPALEVARFCTKWPAVPNWDNEIAGKINMLFNEIMKQSGFNLEPTIVEL